MNAARGTRRPHSTRPYKRGRSSGGGDETGPGVGCFPSLGRFFLRLMLLGCVVLAVFIALKIGGVL